MTCSLDTTLDAGLSRPLAAKTVAVPAETDPLLVLIDGYRHAEAYFNANAPDDDRASDALAKATFGPLWHQLQVCPPAPTTWAGCLAGFALIEGEGEKVSADDLAGLLRACIAFVRKSKSN